MGCATGTVKYTLSVLNFLWAMLGIIIMVFAGLGWDQMPLRLAVIIVVAGSAMLMISFVGCLGTMRESTRLMWTYVVLMVVFFVACLALMLISTPEVFKKYAMQGVVRTWSKEADQPGAMDNIQVTYSCCGLNSASDYIAILERSPPASCCKEMNCINPLNLYLSGCLSKVEEAFADETITTKICRWSLLSFDLIITILALLLAIHLTNRKRRYNY